MCRDEWHDRRLPSLLVRGVVRSDIRCRAVPPGSDCNSEIGYVAGDEIETESAGKGYRMKSNEATDPKRVWTARAFTFVEDVVYVGLGVLLAGGSIFLLISGLITFGQHLIAGSLAANIVPILDRILLILLVVELLYTVQVSFREHSVTPEPFLLVGLIAAIRRVLVLTAELAQVHQQSEEIFRRFLIELVVLTVLIVALVVSLVLLKKRGVDVAAERAT